VLAVLTLVFCGCVVGAVAAAADGVPVMLQNAPPPAGSGLPVSVVLDIARAVPEIAYVKEEALPAGARISATLAGAPATLTILVTRHKYWRVTVDGTDAAVSPANVAFQAVSVPAGRHRIEMRYRNPFVARGTVISGLTLLALIVPIPPRRRPRSES